MLTWGLDYVDADLHVVTLSKASRPLEWRHITQLEAYQVIEYKVCAPCSTQTTRGITLRLGQAHGVLQYAVRSGLPMTVTAIRLALRCLGEIPRGQRRDTLVSQLVTALLPEEDVEAAMSAMQVQKQDELLEKQVADETLQQVLEEMDDDEVKDLKAAAKRRQVRLTTQARTTTAQKKQGQPVEQPPVPAPEPAPASASASSSADISDAPRAIVRVFLSPMEVLRQLTPPAVGSSRPSLMCDQNALRWKAAFPTPADGPELMAPYRAASLSKVFGFTSGSTTWQDALTICCTWLWDKHWLVNGRNSDETMPDLEQAVLDYLEEHFISSMPREPKRYKTG